MNVKLEIRHLRLLDAIAEEGGVTAAAKRLHTTQSALSHQLRDAEQRLEARLFLRLGKKMVLTPAGDHLLAAGRRALEELGLVQRVARVHHRPPPRERPAWQVRLLPNKLL